MKTRCRMDAAIGANFPGCHGTHAELESQGHQSALGCGSCQTSGFGGGLPGCRIRNSLLLTCQFGDCTIDGRDGLELEESRQDLRHLTLSLESQARSGLKGSQRLHPAVTMNRSTHWLSSLPLFFLDMTYHKKTGFVVFPWYFMVFHGVSWCDSCSLPHESCCSYCTSAALQLLCVLEFHLRFN